MNLGKTITLPGSWESLNVVGRTCANAGAAIASAGTSSAARRAPFIFNFMVCSLLLRHAAGNGDADGFLSFISCRLSYPRYWLERKTQNFDKCQQNFAGRSNSES